MKIKITEQEKQIIEKLNHPLYSVKFLQEWINRKETVYENAPCALQCCCAHGYYDAVKQIAKTVAANAEEITVNAAAIEKAEKLLAGRDKGAFEFSGNLCVELAEALLALAPRRP